ncbi:hypothetical protein QTP70_009933 [Hemibagrus guttatus]|uniref:Uncharacterized protein n=1 Tax=Hemibagrus guttatus TaxID=175788 RepID=A0AAE0R1D1_9TELE|nr:hypothetical protein QTP70_009933 [Hemibagrus guttatus]
MDKRKDLSEFDQKGQIVMARPLDQNISKTAALVGCSRSAVVSIYQKWSKEGTVVNRRQGHGRSRHIDARMERRLARVVRSNRRATVAQIAEEVNAGSDRKGSEYTVQDGSGLFWQQKGSCYVMLHRYCWSAKWGLDQNIQRNAESCPITSHNQEKECELIVRYQTQQLNSSSDAELKLDGFQEEASPSGVWSARARVMSCPLIAFFIIGMLGIMCSGSRDSFLPPPPPPPLHLSLKQE